MKRRSTLTSLLKVFLLLSVVLIKPLSSDAQCTGCAAATCVDSFYYPWYVPYTISDGTSTWTNSNWSTYTCCSSASTWGGSGDYTGSVTFNATAGSNCNLSIATQSGYPTSYGLWVDWNNDGVFQSNEYVASYAQSGSLNYNPNASFYIPGYTAAGQYRMRMVSSYYYYTYYISSTSPPGAGNLASIGACGNWYSSSNPAYNYGGYEGGWFDFTLQITNNYTCYPPQSLVTTGVTGNGASFSWASPPASTPLGYQWIVLNSGGTPGVSTPVTGGFVNGVTTTATASGLNSSTLYNVYVRSYCGSLSTDTSVWTLGTSFTTLSPPCSGAVAPITITSATIPTSSPICLGASLNLTASNPNTTVSGVNVYWALASTNGNPPFTPITAATYGGSSGFTTLNYTTFAMPITAASAVWLTVFDSCVWVPGTATHGNVYKIPILSYSVPYSEDFYSTPNNAEPACYKKDVNPQYGQFAVQHGYMTANGTNITANVMPFLNACCNTPQLSDYFTIPALNLLSGTTYTITFDYSRNNQNYQPHVQLYANIADPGTAYSFGSTNVTNGTLLLDSTVNFNGVRHATTTYTASGGLTYFTWYTNTTEAQSIPYGTSLGISNVNVFIANPCATPTAQPTALNLASNVNSVTGTFTPVANVNHYLVVRTSNTAVATGPVDGQQYTVGDICGNGKVVAIAHTPAFTDLGLVANTQYTYTIYSVNDLCTGGPLYDHASPLTGTISTSGPRTYVWNKTVQGDFTVAANWTPNRVTPDQSDILIFNNSVLDTAYNVPTQVITGLKIINNTTVRLWGASGSTLSIASDGDSTTNELSINAGSSLLLDGTAGTFKLGYTGVGVTGLINGVLEMVETGPQNVFDCTGGKTTVGLTGSLNEGGSASAIGIISQLYNLIVNGTVTFKFTSVNGPAIPMATWNTGSTMLFAGYTTATGAPNGANYSTFTGGFNQQFYNMTYNCPAQTSNINWGGAMGPGSFTVLGTFTMVSTGTGQLSLAGSSQPYRAQINNFSQTGGKLYISSSTAAGIYHFQVAGSFNQTGGTFGLDPTVAQVYSSADFCLTFNGTSGTQNVSFASNPIGTLTYRFINPNGINLTVGSAMNNSFRINPGGGIRISNVVNNPITTSAVVYDSIYTGSISIPNPEPTLLTFDSASAGTVISSVIWPALNGGSTGTQFGPQFVVINIGQNSAIKFPSGFNRILSYTTGAGTASGCGILKLLQGNLDIGANTLQLGINAAAYGQLWAAATSMIQTTAGGTLTRWWPSNGMQSGAFASASTSADARGYFPLSSGAAPRFVQIFGSTTTLTAGPMSVTHTPQTLLTTGLNIPDGITITQRTNANWTISTSGAYAFAGTYNLKISAGNLFTSPTPTNLRVMNANSVVGSHVTANSATIANNPLPYYYSQRSGLSTAQLNATWYIGGGATDMNVNNIWTAINTGAWNNASTWDVNSVPPATAWCYINGGVNVTVGSNNDVAKYLVNNGTLTVSTPSTRLTIDSFLYNNGTINMSGGTDDSLVVNGSYTVNPTLAIPTNNYGTLNVSGGVLRLGPVGGGKVPFQNYGTVNVTGGMLAINGNLNLSLVATNYFFQSGGTIRLDGNAGGVATKSVNVPLLNFGSLGVVNANFNGGTLIIVDPSAQPYTSSYSGGNAVNVINYTGSSYQNPFVPPHTLQFGDGVSLDPGGSPTLGFYVYSNSAPYFSYGNIVINTGNATSSSYGTNRFFSFYYMLNIWGNLTVMPYGEYGGTYYAGHYSSCPTCYTAYSLYTEANDSITVMLNGKAEFSYLQWCKYVQGTQYSTPPTYHQAFINYNPVTAPNIWDGYYEPYYSNYWPSYLTSVTSGHRIPSAYYMYFFSAQPVFLGNIAIGYGNYFMPISVYSGNASYSNRPAIITAPPSFNGAFNAVVEPPGCGLNTVYTPSQTNGWVNGFYQKHATNGGIAHTYWTGDSAWFTPVQITNMTGQTAITQEGDIAVKSTPLTHPYIASSGLNPNKTLSRFFSIVPVPNAVTAQNIHFNQNSMFATFNWVAGDVPQGALNFAFTPARDSTGVYWPGTSSVPVSNPHWFTTSSPVNPLVYGSVSSGVGVIKNLGNLMGDYTFGETCPKTTVSGQPQALNICSNIPASFTVDATGLGLTYQWYKNGIALTSTSNVTGVTSPTLNIASATVSDTGCYYAIVMSTCDVPLTTNTACLQITQAALITSTTSTQTLCVGGTVTLTGAAIGQAPLTYKWYKNGGLQSQWNGQTSVTISNVNVTNSGVYTFTATNNCRTDSTNPGDTVIVNPAPPAVITPQGPATFCAGDSVIFLASTGTGYNYSWSINGVAQTNNTSSLTVYNTAGINVTITDANGCTATSVTDSVTTLAAPTAAITASGPLAFCTGGNVTMTSNTGLGYVYQWQQDAGSGFANVSGAVASTYMASTAGIYRVKITNGGGCSALSNVDTVVVNTPPAVTSSAVGPTTFCQGASVILQTNPTSVTYTYDWKNNGSSVGNASSINANAAGSYTNTVTDANGCSTTTAAIVVTVNPLPTATSSALSTTSLCPGNSVVLEANAGSGLTYQWYNGGPISGATSITYTANTAGNYTVRVTNSNNCSATSTPITVTVNPANASITPTPSNSTVCQGNVVLLSAPGCGGCVYEWDENSTSGYVPISGATASTYNATVQGRYRVKVTNGSGCFAYSSGDSVTILPLPTSSATALGATSFCSGGSVQIAAGPYAGNSYTYAWYFNNTLMPDVTDTITVNATGAYYVVVTNTGTCSQASNTINVSSLPNPSPAINAGGSLSICSGQTVTLSGSPLGAYNYQWMEDTGTGYFPIPGATSANYDAGATGNYEVIVTTQSANCTGTSAPEAVFVNPVPYQTTSGPLEFCFGSNVNLLAHGGSGANLSYEWYAVGGSTTQPIVTGSTFLVYQAGQYYCKVSVLGSCYQYSDTMTVIVDSLPTTGIHYGSGQLGADPYSSYQWFVNGSLIPGATGQFITPTIPGDYKVMVTNGKGCSAYSPVYHWGNTNVANVGNGTDISIYPNPAASYIHIDAPVKVNVYISSVDGKVVMHQDEATTMDLNALANGVYMIKVYDKAGALLKVEKLVKNGN